MLGHLSQARAALSEEIISLPARASTKPTSKEDKYVPFWEHEKKYTTVEQLHQQEGYRLMELANLAYNNALFGLSEDLYTKSLNHFMHIHNRRGETLILNGLGNIHLYAGKSDLALKEYRRATMIAQDIQFFRHAAICLSQEANILRDRGEFEQAELAYTEALTTQRQLGYTTSMCSILGNMALLKAKEEKRDEAIALYRETILLCVEVGDQKFEGINCGNLADELRKKGQSEEAKAMFERSMTLCAQSLPIAEVVFRMGYAQMLLKEGRKKQAINLLERDDSALRSSPQEFVEYLCKKIDILLETKQKDSVKKTLEILLQYANSHSDMILEKHVGEIEKRKKIVDD
jgi:tetratricopeptide (TPR) repeat protein